MTTSQQDMRAEFEEWRLGGTLVSTTNPYKELTQPCQFWSFEAWQHRQQELDALQAKLDAVMLEYCPEEMTQEQTEKWAISQVVSDNSELDAARLDNQKLREFIEYWSHDSRLMTFESRQVFRSGAEQLLASEAFTEALAVQQEKA